MHKVPRNFRTMTDSDLVSKETRSFFLHLFILILLGYMYLFIHVCHDMYVKVRRQLLRISSSHQPCLTQGLNSDHKAW